MYEKLYHLLFNAITDTLRELEAANYGRAEDILKKVQCDAEEVYISWEGPEET